MEFSYFMLTKKIDIYSEVLFCSACLICVAAINEIFTLLINKTEKLTILSGCLLDAGFLTSKFF